MYPAGIGAGSLRAARELPGSSAGLLSGRPAGRAALCDAVVILMTSHERAHRMQEVSAKQAVLDLLATLLERLSWAAESTSLGDQWDGLVPALLMGSGATMSATDRAALRLLRILQARRHQEFSYGGAESEASPVNVAGAWTPEGPAGTGSATDHCPTVPSRSGEYDDRGCDYGSIDFLLYYQSEML